MRWTPNYHTACKLQDKILETIGVARVRGKVMPAPGVPLKPSDLSSLIKAWDTLEERKRVLRMKPAPKAIDVSVKEKKAPAMLVPQE